MHIGDQSMESLISIAEHYANKIVQPALIIYSTKAYTSVYSTKFIKKLMPNNEHVEVVARDDFTHIDIYYKPEAVQMSADAAANFFNK